jgi:uncharacterized protein (DUF885 family)
MKRHFLQIFSPILFIFFVILGAWQVHATPQREFASYLNQLFADWVSADTVTLHYNLANPSNYQIQMERISLTNTFLKNTSDYTKTLNQLHTFDTKNLSSSQKFIYHVLNDYLTREKEVSKYPLYQTIFSPTTGIQAQLPVTLCEFPIRSEDDILIYFSLLKEIPDYFQDLYEIEQEKASKGLFCSNRTLELILEQMDSFLSESEANPLITSFSEHIKSIPLSNQKKRKYTKLNKHLILYTVLTSYRVLRNHLASLKGSGKNNLGLCYYENGKEYYSALAALLTGSDATPEEMIQATEKNIKNCYQKLQEILYLYPDVYDQFLNTEISDYIPSTETEILEFLKNSISDEFPSISDTSYTVKYVPDCLTSYVSPAFYMIPAIDEHQNNTIYINKQQLPSISESYSVLAHEGYPGHLYQTNYFYQNLAHPILSLCNYEGFVEGWAVYAENLSYSFLDFGSNSDTIIKLYQINHILNLAIPARIDLGVHYEGWNKQNVTNLLSSLGLESKNIDSDIFDTIIAEPGNYLSYYIGYLEISSLRKKYYNSIDKNNKNTDFYAFVLKNTPCDFHYLHLLTNVTP